jgi:hypothetical protein
MLHKLYYYHIYKIDSDLIKVCKSEHTDNCKLVITVHNLEVNLVSTSCPMIVRNGNKILNYEKKDITKVLYGISEQEADDVTLKAIKYLNNNNVISTSVNVNSIFGDPFPGKPKKLFVYTNNDQSPSITIDELRTRLKSNLILFGTNPLNSKYGSVIATIKVPKILIYLIYHDNKSYEVIKKYENYPYIKIFYNQSTKYFESYIYWYLHKNKHEWQGMDYVGMLTYSFMSKINIKLDELYQRVLQSLHTTDYDLISFYNFPFNMLRSFHGKIGEIFNSTLHEFGFKVPINFSNVYVFFCNYWITKPYLMSEYLDFATKYMTKLDNQNNKYLQLALNSNSGYTKVRGAKLLPERLMQIAGFPYYTHHAFVMERLPCLFFWNKGLRKSKSANIPEPLSAFKL